MDNTRAQIELERRSLDVVQAEVDRRDSLVASGAASVATLEQSQRDLITQERRVLDLEKPAGAVSRPAHQRRGNDQDPRG